MRPAATLCCLLMSFLVTGERALFADDLEFDDPEMAQEFKLRKIADDPEDPRKSRSPSGRRALAILNAKREAERNDIVRRLESLGLPRNPTSGELPSAEKLKTIRELADQARKEYPYSVELDLLNDYLDVIDNRLALEFVGGIDLDKPAADFNPKELERLRELRQHPIYGRTNVADRVGDIFAERRARAELDALDLALDPEVAAEFDREARREFTIALRLVPAQRVRRLRELSEIYRGTPTADEVAELIEHARTNAANDRARRAAEDAAYQARASMLRAYWSPRYGHWPRGW